MFDVSSYSNGFGVVFVPFVVGVIIRSILATLNAGSRRSNLMMCIFIVFLVVPNFVIAGTFTDTIESYEHDGINTYIVIDSVQYYSDIVPFNDIIISSFNNNQEVIVIYNDSTKRIENISLNTSVNNDSKNISLFLGGMGCAAFALGISLKI